MPELVADDAAAPKTPPTMSASMLRQMLEDAGAQLKERKFQEALDGSRRVTQFDPTNFQAFLCVGLASLHLQQVRFVSSRSDAERWSLMAVYHCSGRSARRRFGARRTSNPRCLRRGR